MPLVSVVIPTYNCAKYLPRAIDSVLDQTHGDFEIIVVDDGSSDNTPETLLRYLGKIVLLRQCNAGAAVARNRGIHEARSKYIAFLDADDFWHPQRLEKQIPLIESNGHVGLVYGGFSYVSERGSFLKNGRARWLSGKVAGIDLLRLRVYIDTVVARRNLLLETGGFDPRFKVAHDMDLWIRLASCGSIDYVPEVVAFTRRRENSLTGDYITGALESLDCLELNYHRFRRTSGITRREYLKLRSDRLSKIGRELLRRGHIRAALDCLRSSLRSNPMNYGCLLRLVRLLFQM